MPLLPLLALAAALPQFTEHTVATGLKSGYQVVVADMNRDGKPDLIALASGMDELVWFENPGWQRHVIAGGFKQMINLAYLDEAGDGAPAIVLAHGFSNQAKNSLGLVSVLRPRRGQPEQPWTIVEIDRIPTSHRLRVANLPGKGKVVVNAPLTGAGAEPPDFRGQTPLVYYTRGDWMRHTISNQDEGVVHGIWVMDWDGDGSDEVLTASMVGIHLYQQRDGVWTRTRLAAGDPSPWPQSGSSDLAVGHTRKKVRFLAAIEPWHGTQVAIYTQQKGQWLRQVIDDTLVDGHTVITADFDGDGTDEVVAGFRGGARSVFLYTTDEKARKWTKQVIDNGGIATAACAPVDVNGDGRLDFACIGSATANLKWYENKAR